MKLLDIYIYREREKLKSLNFVYFVDYMAPGLFYSS
jgi:hypothetical protein